MNQKKLLIILSIAIVLIATAVFFLIKDNSTEPTTSFAEISCKDLGTGISKICEPSAPATIGSQFNADDFYFDFFPPTENQATSGKLRYPGGDWGAVNLEDYEGSIAFFRDYQKNFKVFSRGGKLNRQFHGYVYMTNAPESWSDGHYRLEKEVITDRRNFINRMYVKNLGTTFYLHGSIAPELLIDEAWVTDIDGEFCGVRANIQTVKTVYGTANQPLTRNYEVLNTVYPCPNSVIHSGPGVWKLNYTDHPMGEIRTYTGILTTSKVDGVSTGAEDEISEWINNYDYKKQQVKSDFEGYMRSFKVPSGTNDEKLDYYRFLLNGWLGTHRPVSDTSPQDNFFVDGKWRYFVMPNIQGYWGMWIWDSAMLLQGLLAAYDPSTANPFTRELINDILTTWGKTQNKYPIVDEWDGTLYEQAKTKDGFSQPAELYVPITLEAYRFGLISQSLMCNDLYPALQAHYYNYKQMAGPDYLFSIGSGYGRDGSALVGGTSAETGATAGWAMMAIGMATMANKCGYDYIPYVNDYSSIKQAFNTMWVEDRQTYWNFAQGGTTFKELNTSNIGTTPFGACMAIVADLVPSDRIAKQFNTLEQYFVDGYNTTPIGIGYTSVATTATYYCGAEGTSACRTTYGGGTWNGPTWSWVDGILCTQAIDFATDKYGLTELNPTKEKIHQREFFLIGRWSIFPMESYASTTGNVAQWSSRPYMPAGNTIPTIINDYNIYSSFDYSLLGGCTAETCGNGICSSSCGETISTCPADCQPICGPCVDACYENLKLYNGHCVNGACVYDQSNCNFGCSNAQCNPDPCLGESCGNNECNSFCGENITTCIPDCGNCIPATSHVCTNSEGKEGTQTCGTNGMWGECIVPEPEPPAEKPPIDMAKVGVFVGASILLIVIVIILRRRP